MAAITARVTTGTIRPGNAGKKHRKIKHKQERRCGCCVSRRQRGSGNGATDGIKCIEVSHEGRQIRIFEHHIGFLSR